MMIKLNGWSLPYLAAMVLALGCGLAQAQRSASAARPAAAQAALTVAPAAPTPVREMGGIQEYRLANGLQVLLLHDPTQTTATVNITYRVGSRHEAPGEYGMAHLLEHMLFKGTTRLSAV